MTTLGVLRTFGLSRALKHEYSRVNRLWRRRSSFPRLCLLRNARQCGQTDESFAVANLKAVVHEAGDSNGFQGDRVCDYQSELRGESHAQAPHRPDCCRFMEVFSYIISFF